jgi:hypothetical protein
MQKAKYWAVSRDHYTKMITKKLVEKDAQIDYTSKDYETKSGWYERYEPPIPKVKKVYTELVKFINKNRIVSAIISAVLAAVIIWLVLGNK